MTTIQSDLGKIDNYTGGRLNEAYIWCRQEIRQLMYEGRSRSEFQPHLLRHLVARYPELKTDYHTLVALIAIREAML